MLCVAQNSETNSPADEEEDLRILEHEETLILPLDCAVLMEPEEPRAQGTILLIVGRGWRQERSLQHVRLQLAPREVTTCQGR